MKKDENIGCGTAIGMLFLVIVCPVFSGFMRAFIMRDCWAWFVMPVAPSLTALTLLQCMGLQCFVRSSSNVFRGATNDSRLRAIAKHLDVDDDWRGAARASGLIAFVGWPLVWCGAWFTHVVIGWLS
jgi:hypothetical protein